MLLVIVFSIFYFLIVLFTEVSMMCVASTGNNGVLTVKPRWFTFLMAKAGNKGIKRTFDEDPDATIVGESMNPMFMKVCCNSRNAWRARFAAWKFVGSLAVSFCFEILCSAGSRFLLCPCIPPRDHSSICVCVSQAQSGQVTEADMNELFASEIPPNLSMQQWAAIRFSHVNSLKTIKELMGEVKAARVSQNSVTNAPARPAQRPVVTAARRMRREYSGKMSVNDAGGPEIPSVVEQ